MSCLLFQDLLGIESILSSACIVYRDASCIDRDQDHIAFDRNESHLQPPASTRRPRNLKRLVLWCHFSLWIFISNTTIVITAPTGNLAVFFFLSLFAITQISFTIHSFQYTRCCFQASSDLTMDTIISIWVDRLVLPTRLLDGPGILALH